MGCRECHVDVQHGSEGRVFSYLHHNGRMGSLVHLRAITDFCLSSEPVQKFGNDLCQQVAAVHPCCVDSLLTQQSIRHTDKTVEEYLIEVRDLVKEPLSILKIVRIGIDD